MKKRYPPFTLSAQNLPNTRHPVKRSNKYFDAKPARTVSITKSLSKSSSTHYSDRPHPNGKRSLKKQVGVGEMMYIHDNVLGHYTPSKKRSASSAIKKNIFDNNLFDVDDKRFNFDKPNKPMKPKAFLPDTSVRKPKQFDAKAKSLQSLPVDDLVNVSFKRKSTSPVTDKIYTSLNKPAPKDSDYVPAFSYPQTDYGLPLTVGLLREINQRKEKAEQEYRRQQEEAQRQQEEYQRRQEEILRLQEESYKQQSSSPSSAQSYSNQPWGGLGNYSIEDIYNYLYDNGYIE